MASLTLHLLGPFQAALGERPAAGFESCKVRALLAYLVTEADRPHTRNHLAGLLWPSLPEPAALGNLRHSLANLRRVLGDHDAAPPFIASDDHHLQFNRASDHCTDVALFTRLIEESSRGTPAIEPLACAVGLYQGDFLEGLDLCGCAEFQEWTLLRREGCGWLLMTALRLLCDGYTHARRYDEAALCARQMILREPWDEVAHQHLMRALALAGHRGDALRQYAECRRLLLAELQVEPSSITKALYERIRDSAFPQPPTVEPARRRPARRRGGKMNPGWSPVNTAPAQAIEFALDL